MKVIADLQIHSKYSRACSQDLTPGNIGIWADKKGIGIIGTGDFTHPGWLSELKDNLEEAKPGLYKLKANPLKALFMLTAEVSSIYKQGEKVRRIHNMILAPNFAAVDRIREALEARGCNLKSDGRPIIGLHCDELVKIVLEADPACVIIPAHAWTPHFGLFGSLSGFDSVEEAFGDQAKHIFAIETGLSSDPRMNWQISALDKYSLLSNSDAHSLRKIGREANVLEIAEDKLSYDEIIRVIKDKDPKEFLFTIEFFPEEGKYHLDGHADCKFSCLPAETARLKGICPKCAKKLLVGVLNRVEVLGDRAEGEKPTNAIPFKNVIPLEEVIAETLGIGPASKKVQDVFARISPYTEFQVLLDLPREELEKICGSAVAESIIRVREGKVKWDAGYDGVFGKVHIYEDKERKQILKKSEQVSLF
ncbi:MAG: endonuclease Q family protein [Candidatus Doudnabacteria bacterium]|nr:endonuclease Q family protein [Candidatus Doudnabacteria bacterium]